ncbi:MULTISPECIES: Hsp20/alpha crystallin family protein [unclassified Bifidobacterium]|uniref:Hsp20/alpha crystallin family protein n=1 Tax=unclassified Bifidobacterium TaxID=2608897 RepID=UPI0023F991DD|nr:MULTISPECIES: Hsp20/alpha crystallin family protein [unclassified Bifidobacterium]WEV64635.1 Hsp20/alpha crystallin family protein [Bifidobacterium sp. ESL0732]WEV65232.1 Hsp20/alpha crystallin family protein [Bifidobacterium sp. ESL0764]WEV75964.1 Hsp20/alpha crystallin family protein [Bifidobacterium sp. ESL0800]
MAMFPALMHDAFSDLFDDPFFAGWGDSSNRMGNPISSANMMKTDVRETDKAYDVSIDMPGFNKDDIALELHDGYLTVSAKRDESHDEKNDEGKWLRRERYAGTCSRSFYVGDEVKESDVHANYKNGTLSLEIAKVQPAPKVEAKHQIAIEG